MSDLLLPIAEDRAGTTYHITAPPPRGTELVCPFCRAEVIQRLGKIRRAHFAHKAGADCPATQETLLHEGAKHYVLGRLRAGATFEIEVPVSIMDGVTGKVLAAAGIQTVSVSSFRICPTYLFPRHDLEKNLPCGLRPDVCSYGPEGSPSTLAWEIYVTHHVEDEKAAIFAANGVPFVELIPEPTEDGYRFMLKNYGGLTVLDVDRTFMNEVYEENAGALFDRHREQLESELIRQQVEAALESERGYELCRYGRQLIRQIADSVTPQIFADAFVCLDFEKKIHGQEAAIFPVERIEYNVGNFQNGIRFNGRFHLESPIFFYSSFLETLSSLGYARGVQVAWKETRQIIGVKLDIPCLNGERLDDWLLVDDRRPESYSLVEIEGAGGRRKKDGSGVYMVVNDSGFGSARCFVYSHDKQIRKAMQFLQRHFPLQIIVKDGNAVGLKVLGLMNQEEFSRRFYGFLLDQEGILCERKGIVSFEWGEEERE